MKQTSRFLIPLALGVGLTLFPATAQTDPASEPERGAEPAQAATEPADQDHEPVYTLPTVTVTGEFEAATQSPVVPVSTPYGTQFNVVTEEQIKQQGSLDFLDTLRNVPGVMFSKHNMIGTNTSTSLYIRGRGYNHPSLETTTYFDGVPRNGLIYGQSMADSLPVFATGNLEVYKYPQPSRFGAGYALVNVVPKYMTEEGWEFRIGSSGGSFQTIAENAAFGFKAGPIDLYAAQSWISTDGHTDHSDAYQQNYYLNLGLTANEHWAMRFLANYVDAKTSQPREIGKNPKDVLQRYDTNTVFATTTVNHNYDKAYGFIKFYYNNTNFFIRHESNSYYDWSKQPLTATGIKAKETLTLWKGNELVTGIDLDRTQTTNEDHNTKSPTVISLFPDMHLLSPYAAMSQYFGKPEGFHVIPSAGLRGYLHDVWESKVAPQGGLVLGWANTDLNFNYAFGVVYPAPAIIQTWVDNNPEYAVEDLKTSKSEVVHHFEVGLTHTWPKLFTVGFSCFYDDGRDRIVSGGGTGGVPGNAASVDYFRISGLELSGSVSPLKDLELFAGGTFLRITAKGKEDVEVNQMFYTPDFSMSAGFKWTWFTHFHLSGDYQHLGGLYAGSLMPDASFSSKPSEATKLDDINLVNLRFSYTFAYERWHIAEAEAFIVVNNVLNQTYTYYLNNEMPGITFMIGANIGFH
jgi:iron complex outermembrane receptor protein